MGGYYYDFTVSVDREREWEEGRRKYVLHVSVKNPKISPRPYKTVYHVFPDDMSTGELQYWVEMHISMAVNAFMRAIHYRDPEVVLL